MAKFALRGLAQSMARELGPLVVIDGAVRRRIGQEAFDTLDAWLDPDAIAATYLHVLHQPRNAWTWEIELRPWVEKF
jgi:hypothetical protein